MAAVVWNERTDCMLCFQSCSTVSPLYIVSSFRSSSAGTSLISPRPLFPLPSCVDDGLPLCSCFCCFVFLFPSPPPLTLWPPTLPSLHLIIEMLLFSLDLSATLLHSGAVGDVATPIFSTNNTILWYNLSRKMVGRSLIVIITDWFSLNSNLCDSFNQKAV